MRNKPHSFAFVLLLLLIFLGIVSIIALKPGLTTEARHGIMKWDTRFQLPATGEASANYGTSPSK